MDLPVDVSPVDSEYTNDRTGFAVTWSDGHKSLYNIDFLYNSQVEQKIARSKIPTSVTSWNKSIIMQNEQHLKVTLTDLISSDETVKNVVANLIRFGITFIEEVPSNITMSEMAIRRVFPIMKTIFGEMFAFSDTGDHADSAYSNSFIGSHTDNTYFCDAAGLLSLHCLEHVNGTGGENFFVDGLFAVQELKRRNPRAYVVLSTVQVPAQYVEPEQNHRHCAPIIRLNPITGEVEQIRLNLYDRMPIDTIPQSEMQEFYSCLREFLNIVHNEDNRWRFKLHPGTFVIFDNWRVFHAREAFTGKRIMTGAYVQRTDFLSKARILGLID